MNMFRCLGLSVIILLGACDAQDTPVPKPKTQSSAPVSTPSPSPVTSEVPSTVDSPRESVINDAAADKAAVATHQMMPNTPVKPVVAGQDATPPVPPRPIQEVSATAKSASKSVAAKSSTGKRQVAGKADKDVKAKDVRLNRPKLDLTLPPELVKELEPPAKVITAKRKPILPQMFGGKESDSDPGPFEMNGRLLSNEMQLQMRNDNRRDVEGAALDFKFKQ